jgi:hypothetical protein
MDLRGVPLNFQTKPQVEFICPPGLGEMAYAPELALKTATGCNHGYAAVVSGFALLVDIWLLMELVVYRSLLGGAPQL